MNRLLTFTSALVLSGSAFSAVVSGQGTWETTLLARDLDGDLSTIEAYYDTVLDITWLADANYAQTSGYDPDGLMNWADANAWAAGLTLGGFMDWRLADTVQPDMSCSEQNGGDSYSFNCTGSAMGALYYNTLGNDIEMFTNTGPFNNLQPYGYWSATRDAPSTPYAWYYQFVNGTQFKTDETYDLYAWAVHTGDVGSAVVPIPGAAWLFLSAVGGLIGLKRSLK